MWGFCALLWDQEVQVKTERLAEKPWDFAGLWFIGVVVVIYIYIYIKNSIKYKRPIVPGWSKQM